MGTKCAPTYATLVLGYLEEKLYNIIEDTFDKEFREYFEKMWCRYLDDCFIIMKGNLQDLTKLHHTLNSLLPCLKVTMEHDNTNLPFLDIMVINNNCKNRNTFILKRQTVNNISFTHLVTHGILKTIFHTV